MPNEIDSSDLMWVETLTPPITRRRFNPRESVDSIFFENTIPQPKKPAKQYKCADCGADCGDDPWGHYTLKDKTILCKKCITGPKIYECNNCGYRYRRGQGEILDGYDQDICSNCAEQEYLKCSTCLQFYRTTERLRNGQPCECCYQLETTPILEYDFRVRMEPLGKGPHFMGVELEVECGDESTYQKALHIKPIIKDFAICKMDGSLSNGFEVVTRPMDLAEHKIRWIPFFARGIAGLKSAKTKTCGMHVHCSSKPLTDLTIAKIVCFVNARHNRNFIKMIAGRSSDEWAYFKHKKIGKCKKTGNKYEAVNLSPRRTIEFRIFKGTLKKESFFKNIEFCDALVRFCLPAGRSLRECISRVKFIDFLRERDYPYLMSFIDAKWFGKETDLSRKFGFKAKEQNIEDEVISPDIW